MRMPTKKSKIVAVAAALFAFLPIVVSAHPGPGTHTGFLAGFAHPFTGIDHLLAMFAVGLWLTQLARRAVGGMLALVFVLMLAFLHGHVHDAGLPQFAAIAGYFAGFSLASMVLIAVGYGFGTTLRSWPPAARSRPISPDSLVRSPLPPS